MTRRALLTSASVAGVAAAVGACGPGAAGRTGTTGTTGVARTTGTSSGVVVRDQRDRRITLARPARRIVTIPFPAASMLVAVDQGSEHLVGMNDASWVAMRDGIMGQLFPQTASIAHDVAGASFAPNVESVLSLRPDVVIQWGDQGTGITAPLENAGLEVVGLNLGTQQDLETWITLFAALLGKPQRALAINSSIASSLRDIAALGRTAPKPPPRVLYFNRFAAGLKVAGNKTYNDFYIRLVGAANPAAGPNGAPGKGMVGVDVEQVLAWDPDVILLGNFDAALPDDVYGNDVWKGISAVRQRRVYKVPLGGYRWDPPSHESPLMWRWLSMVAFPQQHRFDLRAEVDRYYRLYYGRTASAKQLDAILWMPVNGRSASYRQFDAS